MIANALHNLIVDPRPYSLSDYLIPMLGGNLTYGLATWILFRFFRVNPVLPGLSDVRWFLFVMAFAAPFVAGVFQVSGYVWSGNIPASAWLQVVSSFWAGDAAGITAIAPLVLHGLGWIRRSKEDRQVALAKWIKRQYAWLTLAQWVALTMAAWIAFAAPWSQDLSYQYAAFIPLILFAMQRAYTGGLLAVFAINTAALIFGRENVNDPGKLMAMQFFVGVAGYTGILLGAAIRERNQAQARLRHMAHYDSQTGLLNRSGFIEELHTALNQTRSLAVMTLDLLRLRDYNASRGPGFGDRILQELADRLKALPQPGLVPARLWGDDFGLLVKEVSSPEVAQTLADGVYMVLSQPIHIGEDEIRPSLNMGVVLSQKDSTPEVLLQQAIAARQRARGLEGKRVVVLDRLQEGQDRVSLERDLRRGIERGEFILFYQPVIDLTTGRVIALEALTRWQHPSMGLLTPQTFIPLAEETGLIVPLSLSLLSQACFQLKAWRRKHPLLKINFNVSGRWLLEHDCAVQMNQAVQELELEPSTVELEVTESLLVEYDEHTLQRLDELASMGFRLVMDDFGTGYSSILSLKRFPFSVVKVDRLFLLGIPDDPFDTQLLKAIVDFASDLSLQVVVEGVETKGQLEYLSSIGCNQVQGYLLGRPAVAESVTEWLQGNRVRGGGAGFGLWGSEE
jgi:diguanylate cyclase (GGDEF)-like protein